MYCVPWNPCLRAMFHRTNCSPYQSGIPVPSPIYIHFGYIQPIYIHKIDPPSGSYISLTFWSLLNNSWLDGCGLSVCWNPDCLCCHLLPKSQRLPFSGFLPLNISSSAVRDFFRSGRCRCVHCRGSQTMARNYSIKINYVCFSSSSVLVSLVTGVEY